MPRGASSPIRIRVIAVAGRVQRFPGAVDEPAIQPWRDLDGRTAVRRLRREEVPRFGSFQIDQKSTRGSGVTARRRVSAAVALPTACTHCS